MLCRHELKKKREYGDRIRSVEFVFSTFGGLGREATVFYSRLADLLSVKRVHSLQQDAILMLLVIFTFALCYTGPSWEQI